ncbi:hypothetical protein [Streptomyces niveus]|uniref:hypothetical protein n=1 Tax=Streptomyces niveus TaxID=193462 RepID=UPI00344265DE
MVESTVSSRADSVLIAPSRGRTLFHGESGTSSDGIGLVVGVDEYATRKGRVYGTVLSLADAVKPETRSRCSWATVRAASRRANVRAVDMMPGQAQVAADAALIAGLTLPWSSGVVEGHVNRIKMLKRQMFGRAGFALLRKRVLLA